MIVIHTEWDEFRSINFSNFNIKKELRFLTLETYIKLKIFQIKK